PTRRSSDLERTALFGHGRLALGGRLPARARQLRPRCGTGRGADPRPAAADTAGSPSAHPRDLPPGRGGLDALVLTTKNPVDPPRDQGRSCTPSPVVVCPLLSVPLPEQRSSEPLPCRLLLIRGGGRRCRVGVRVSWWGCGGGRGGGRGLVGGCGGGWRRGARRGGGRVGRRGRWVVWVGRSLPSVMGRSWGRGCC